MEFQVSNLTKNSLELNYRKTPNRLFFWSHAEALVFPMIPREILVFELSMKAKRFLENRWQFEQFSKHNFMNDTNFS